MIQLYRFAVLTAALTVCVRFLTFSQNTPPASTTQGVAFFVPLSSQRLTFGSRSAPEILKEYLPLGAKDQLVPLATQPATDGFAQENFQQFHQGLKVEHGVYKVHSKNGILTALSGELYQVPSDLKLQPTLSEEQALRFALAFVGAKSYKWQVDSEEAWLKKQQQNPGATYYPKGELVISKIHRKNHAPVENGGITLAYKFDIFAHDPVSRDYLYVDAHTGAIILRDAIIKHADGQAHTRFSGTRTIATTLAGTAYRLRDASRGSGVETYNMQSGSSYGSAVDFTDNDNQWTAAEHNNLKKDNAALDCHWAAMLTYDYFKTKHNRNSFDGNGAKIRSYVHYGQNYINAFWDGSVMTFGDGGMYNGKMVEPLTTVDITAHEIGHAVCSHTARLVYSYESGAMNEGFSDIWGACVEYFADPTKSTWTMGEDANFTIRSMSNPNAFGHPDTYLGQHWYGGDGDNGGVHYNSGVLNHWFYLLSIGKTGANDNGDHYAVTGIGIEKAARIAYRTESVYLTANSQYKDARTYSIRAATDLFGANSPEVVQTVNAWYAVGVYDLTSIPTNLRATAASGTQINLSWTDNATNETAYRVERSTSSNTGFTEIASLGANATTYEDRGLATDAMYYYRVRATMGTTNSPYSNTASASVGVPPIVMRNGNVATCNSVFLDPGGMGNYPDNQYTVMTFAPATPGRKIRVSFSAFDTESSSDYLTIYDGNSTYAPLIGSYSGNTVPPVVTATNASGEVTFLFSSNYSNNRPGWQATISCVTPPATPTSLTATAASATQINLSWTDSATDETGFKIERSTAQSTGFVQIGTVGPNVSSYPDAGLPTNTIYYYRVRAYSGTTHSDYSNVASAMLGNAPILMQNGSVTTCNTSFMDSGGTGSYNHNENFIFTITPTDTTKKLRATFSAFQTESCCDYLSVYDGATTNARLIGTYAGYSLPPVITATNPRGQLTFRFASDGSVTGAGWQAMLSCVTVPAPVLTSFSPATGPPGTLVTITGNHLNTTSAVKFGGNAAATFTVVSETQLTATVPANALPGPVTVTNAGGTTTTLGSFTVILPPFSDSNISNLTRIVAGTAAWGDYDNDGDLDVLLTGSDGYYYINAKLFNNQNGVFTDTNTASLTPVSSSAAAWGDYDNDGDLDIVISGYSNSGLVTKIYRNTNGVFADAGFNNLTPVYQGSVAWGDYDNDGDLDLLTTGASNYSNSALTKIYRNTGSTFEPINAGLADVYNGSGIWGDYDNDGDLDILLTGSPNGNASSAIAKLYQNTNGNFTDTNTASLTPVSSSAAAWGDYDNDGDLDLALTGQDRYYYPVTKIYQNTGGAFSQLAAGTLIQVSYGSTAWGDYDNDGDLDLLISGSSSGLYVTKLYRNSGGVFTEVNTSLAGASQSAAAWGDYDNDRDLDILLAGNGLSTTKIYRNNSPVANTLPASPANLTAVTTSNGVTLSWGKATDTQTSQNGLSYNISVGTTSGGGQVVSSMAHVGSGFRRIAAAGNSGHTNGRVIKNLSPGTYYWSVQAIDQGLAGSAFSSQGTFTISKAVAQVALSNLSYTYDGTEKGAAVTTIPANLPVTITYNGSSGRPVNAGTYTVVATITSDFYQGSATGTLVIRKAQASLTITQTAFTYDGAPKSITVTTVPAGLPVQVSYATSVTVPVEAGTYPFTAQIAATANYEGSRQGSFVINKAEQRISLPTFPDRQQGDVPVVLQASASSGLPVSWEVIMGKAALSGNVLTLTGTGQVTIRAVQLGNRNYTAALPVERTFCVNPAQPVVMVADSVSTLTLSSSSASGNQWMRNGNLIPEANGQTYQVTETGSYSVRVTADGCSNTSEAMALTPTEAENVKSRLKLYPNPTYDKIKVEFTPLQHVPGIKLVLYNSLGVPVGEYGLVQDGNTWQLLVDLSAYQSGYYVFSIQYDEKQINQRVIKY